MNSLDNWKIKFLNINGGDMPDSQYFALKGYTSISRLKLLNDRDGSPQKYLEGFSHEYNPSLLLGTLFCKIYLCMYGFYSLLYFNSNNL